VLRHYCEVNQYIRETQLRKVAATDYACNTLTIFFVEILCVPLTPRRGKVLSVSTRHRPADMQERPPIRVKDSFQTTVFEDGQHALPLLNTQESGTAGNGARVQAGHIAPVLPELLSPLTHGHPLR
jgi:hypothetical protein